IRLFAAHRLSRAAFVRAGIRGRGLLLVGPGHNLHALALSGLHHVRVHPAVECLRPKREEPVGVDQSALTWRLISALYSESLLLRQRERLNGRHWGVLGLRP